MLFHTGLHDQYHRSTDDVDLINLDGMVTIGGMLLGVLRELATDPTRPVFTPSVREPRVVALRSR
jgi:aminopeptidase-like protein